MSKQRYALCGLSFKIMKVHFFYLQYNTSQTKDWVSAGTCSENSHSMSHSVKYWWRSCRRQENNVKWFIFCVILYAGTSFRHTPTLWTHLLPHNVHHLSPRTLKLFIAYWYTLGDWVNLPLISAVIWYISAKMTGQYHRRSIVSSQRLYQSFMLLKLNILTDGVNIPNHDFYRSSCFKTRAWLID